MDKNKIKEALKKKLKQEMSMTGTGASVTPGVGAGVATKYAFGKRDNKGTPSDWKAAPSIPNRKSKAMDYKELWEFDATSFFQGQMIQQAMQSAPAVMSETEKIISIVLLAIGTGAIGGGLAAIAKDKLGSLNPILAIKHWFSDRQKRKALEPIIAKLKQDPEVMKYVANKNLRGIQAVIKSKLSPEEQKYIGSLTRDALSESIGYKELWEEPYDKSKIKTNADELARVEDYYKEATSSQKSSAEDRIKKLKILVSLEKKHNTQLPVLTYGTYWVDYLKKQGVKDSKELDAKLSTKKEDINENYARFRNETKTRTKPEQFHSAVKDIKKKVNEINRLFEYMNRLQSELSESEGGLKYKKYTEKSIQQIKESTKQLFFKSTKLK